MRNNRIVYSLTLLTVLIAFLSTDQRVPLILLLIMLALPLVLFVLLRLSVSMISLTCVPPSGLHAKSKGEIRFLVNFRNPFPIGRLFLTLRTENQLFGDRITQQLAVMQGSGRAAEYRLPFESAACGHIVLSLPQVRCCDILGLCSCPLPQKLQATFPVLPEMPQIEVELLHTPYHEHSGTDYDPRRAGEDVSEVYETRAYRPGDSLHAIHWKLSSKLDQLVVREFGRPTNYETVLVFDPAADQLGDNDHAMQSLALGMTISFSRGLLEQNLPHAVGSVRLGVADLTPITDKTAYTEMITGLLSMRIRQDDPNTLDALRTSSLAARSSKLVLVTPHFDEVRVHTLARQINLTVVLLSDTQPDSVREEAGFRLLVLSAQSAREKIHLITL